LLRAIELENFKAFGERVVIPLAPITLLYGENSAGKSSILQALSLLKQSRESRDSHAFLIPRADNGLVDLGSFQEMLFDHDLRRKMSIRLDMDGLVRPDLQQKTAQAPAQIGIEFLFSRESLEKEIELDNFTIVHPKTNDFFAKFMVEERSQGKGKAITETLQVQSSRRLNARIASCIALAPSTARHWQTGFKAALKYRADIASFLKSTLRKLQGDRIDIRYDNTKGVGELEIESFIRYVQQDLELYGKAFGYDEYVARMREKQLGTSVILDNFLPIDYLSDYQTSLIRYLFPSIPPRNALDNLHNSTRAYFYPGVNAPELAIRAGAFAASTLSSLFPLGPWRTPPERWYIFTGTTPQHVGFRGQLLPDLLFRKPDLLSKCNQWFGRLGLGYELKILPLGAEQSDLFEMKLLDTRRRSPIEVGLSDVGFGISQILPFVVQSLLGKRQLISVEQPEVHIHPRLQADLGDLFAEAIQDPLHNQFLIETHSEHLALRILKLIRTKKLSHRDVSILYVQRGDNGSRVLPIRVDEDGDFIDDFPGGFFPERLREL
jgi:hypothetical protein